MFFPFIFTEFITPSFKSSNAGNDANYPNYAFVVFLLSLFSSSFFYNLGYAGYNFYFLSISAKYFPRSPSFNSSFFFSSTFLPSFFLS